MKQRSWKTTVFGVLIAVFLVLTVLILLMSYDFYKQTRNSNLEETNTILRMWEREVNYRLGTINEHVLDLMLTTYESIELLEGTSMLSYSARKACVDAMNNKLLISSDIDFLYIFAPESDLLFLATARSLSTQEILSVQSFINGGILKGTSIGDRTWDIVPIANSGVTYFVKCYQLGKYTVGALSSAAKYDLLSYAQIYGDESGFFILRGDEVRYSRGGSGLHAAIGDRMNSISGRGTISVPMFFSILDAEVHLVMETDYSQILTTTAITLLVIALVCAGLLVVLFILMRRMVLQPTQELLIATGKLKAGEYTYRISTVPESAEFATLTGQFNEMVAQIVNLRISEYEKELEAAESELSLFIAQIRPHFYLNSLNMIMNMTYQDRIDDIRTYIKALSSYLRYVFKVSKTTVTVSDELDNIRSYFQMQRLRFPGSIIDYIGCETAILDKEIPFLSVLTIVENAFKHAVSTPDNSLTLLIQCEEIRDSKRTGFRIAVEDDGGGFPDHYLEQFHADEDKRPERKRERGYFGLAYIRKTLDLMYGENGELILSNVIPHGARVEIRVHERDVE